MFDSAAVSTSVLVFVAGLFAIMVLLWWVTVARGSRAYRAKSAAYLDSQNEIARRQVDALERIASALEKK